jgi:hypothetical protein
MFGEDAFARWNRWDWSCDYESESDLGCFRCYENTRTGGHESLRMGMQTDRRASCTTNQANR